MHKWRTRDAMRDEIYTVKIHWKKKKKNPFAQSTVCDSYSYPLTQQNYTI